MKFETKLEKLGIDENEVKSIIANCFCGEINGAYFIELSKLRKWEIMETIGNYLDTDLLDFDVKFKTFLKTYEITEEQVADLYVEAVNEGAEDIAYTLESNKDVILVLTDDARYENSFVSYAPSQTGEIELLNEKPSWEIEEENEMTENRFVAKYNCGDKFIYDSVVQSDLSMEDAMNLINYTLHEKRFSLKKLTTGNVYLKDASVRRLLNVFDTAEFLNSLTIEKEY